MINKLGFGFLRLPKKGEEFDWENINSMVDAFFLICVNWQVILKVAVLPSEAATVTSVLPEAPLQMAMRKAALYMLLGVPFSITST